MLLPIPTDPQPIEQVPLRSDMANVDAAIVRAVLPTAYACIEDLLQAIDAQRAPSKELLLRCRKLLPRDYPHSFEHRREGAGR